MEKICQHCNKVIQRRSNEHKWRYKTRKYCNQKCTKAYQKEHKEGFFFYSKFPAVREQMPEPRIDLDNLTVM